MELIWFALASYGMTQILCYGKVFDFMRPDYYFFHCPMCIGFWVGVFLWGVNNFTELFMFEVNLANLLLCGWLSSGTSYILCQVFDDDGIKIRGVNK